MFLSHRFDSSERTVGTKSYKIVTDAFYPIFPVSSTPRFGQEGAFLLFLQYIESVFVRRTGGIVLPLPNRSIYPGNGKEVAISPTPVV
jgi:hypothetical protein